ncbi:MAG: hypothetical protein DYG98_10240 [Haliscomenobacteraceae bacterium CHB4]|nr:hypothetical protein [Haliscomenobacteraceae bacterium CHB4]
MKQQLLTIALLFAFFARLSAQDCSLPAANICDSAKFICGYALDGYMGSNYGYQDAPDIPGFSICGNFHNPQFFKIVPCADQISLVVYPSNCAVGNGLQVALADSCSGQIVGCSGGVAGGGNVPLFLTSAVTPGEPYLLIIDGYEGDQCDFTIDILEGMDLTPPSASVALQPGFIGFQAFSCGGGTLTLHLPVCQQNMSAGCTQGWTDFYVNNCLGVNWNLPPGTQIVSADPHAFQITIQFTQPVVNGIVTASFIHTCPGIDQDECPMCIPRCCTSPIAPITISSPPPCTNPYGPPDCVQFNTPAPLADSCHQAPLLCGNYLENFCGSTTGLTPDQPAGATDTIPQFENNGWLRITPCEDSIVIDFQVFDCQTGNELGFFLLSGDCDTMALLSFISATDGNVAHLTAGGLTPGAIYYLAVDGFYNAECKFQVHIVHGIGTASPGEPTCDCTDSYIDGPGDLCPADIVQYTLVPGYCDVSYGQPVGGNGIYCLPPPEACPPGQDSAVLHWVIPPFMNFLSDSINVLTITAQVDSSLLGLDTTLTGTVTVYWEFINPTPLDTTFHCDCLPGCVPGFLPKDVTVHHDVETIYGEISCVEPCYFYNGQPFCAPGVYIVEQTNCLTKKLIIFSDIIPPVANAGPDQQICVGESATIGSSSSSTGAAYTYLWSNGSTALLTTVTPTATTTYSLTVTNTTNGCTSEDNVTVTVVPPTDESVVLELTCAVHEVNFLGNTFTQPGLYTVPKPNGCGDYHVLITNNTTPPQINIAPVPKICYGDFVILTANSNVPMAQYTWSNGMTGAQISVQPPVNNSYSVTVTNPVNGCTNTTTTAVQVILPINTHLPPKTICEGECVYVAGEEFCSGGNHQVVLESYQGCDSVINFSVIVKPYIVTNHGTIGTLTCNLAAISFMGKTYNQPGNYTVPDPGGCGEHQFVIDQDNTPPILNVSPPQQICLGETAMLTADPNSPQVIVTWDDGSSGTQIQVSPAETTTYTVIATDNVNGCTATEDITVTVNPPVDTDLGVAGLLTCNQLEINFLGNTYTQPGQYVVPKPDGCGNNTFTILEDVTPPWCPMLPVSPICAGESVTLQTAPTDPSGLQYLWSTGETTQNISVTPLVTTDYTVTATNPANGCASVVTTTVVVNAPQVVQLGVVGTLTCAQPCVSYNGQEYCQPGTYSYTENCEIKEFQIGEDLSLPTVQLGVVGTLTCAQPCVTFNGQEYCQPGTYSYTENCEIKEFQIGEDLSLPTVQLGVVGTLTCAQPCVTFNGQEYCQPGTYSITENCEIKEFQIGEDLSLPTVQLGVVGTLTCAQPCVTFNGQEYCQPGTYSYTENCEIKEFQIGEDLSLPTVQLGVVGTLTCAQPCVTFNGQEYCQPGTYSITENCEIKEFQIGEDLSLPTVQLGVVGTLTCAQPCVTFNGQEYCQPGTYSITENCEIKAFEIGITSPVWLDLGEDQTIVAGGSAELQAQTNAQPVILTWHNSAGAMQETDLVITVQPSANTLYSLEIQDVNGCLLEDSVWVLVKKAEGDWFAPNVIKPAATGLNSSFTLFASPEYVTEIQLLEIFDRWGDRVFVREHFPPNSPEMGWDGTLAGKAFNPAVFVWRAVLLLQDGTTEIVKGDVTVLR